jgi:hypothetical protein
MIIYFDFEVICLGKFPECKKIEHLTFSFYDLFVYISIFDS